MKQKYWVMAAAALVTAGVGLRVYPQAQPPQQIAAPKTLSYILVFGTQGGGGAKWDGSITATGGSILSVSGWRMSGTDTVTGNSWKLSNHSLSTGPSGVSVYQETGVVVTIPDTGSTVKFAVTTAVGPFSFSTTDVSFGAPLSLLANTYRVMVQQTGSPLALTSSLEDEDYPAMAQSGDNVYLAYTRFVHGDRSQAYSINTTTALTDFSPLARPTGGDQVLLHALLEITARLAGPFPVTNAGEDLMRTAVAVDGQGLVWVFYSAQRQNNFDIYARALDANGNAGPEVHITSAPGVDLWPVATTDAAGVVWVAWQGYRHHNLQVLAAAQTADGFTPETVVSTSRANNWDPAIAAALQRRSGHRLGYIRQGRLRRLHEAGTLRRRNHFGRSHPHRHQRELRGPPQPGLRFSQPAVDRLRDLGSELGQGLGAYDTTGIALYQNHTVAVRCLIGSDLYATADDPARVLPGPPGNNLFVPGTLTAPVVQPDPTLASKRTANNDPAGPSAPRNSFPGSRWTRTTSCTWPSVFHSAQPFLPAP